MPSLPKENTIKVKQFTEMLWSVHIFIISVMVLLPNNSSEGTPVAMNSLYNLFAESRSFHTIKGQSGKIDL